MTVAEQIKKEHKLYQDFIIITLYHEKVIKKRKWCGLIELQRKAGLLEWEGVEYHLRAINNKLVKKVFMHRAFIGYKLTEDGEEYARQKIHKLVHITDKLQTMMIIRGMKQGLDKMKNSVYNVQGVND